MTFSRPFLPSDQCDRNCSFPSGHAAVGFYFSSVAFIFPFRRYLFAVGLIYGIFVALGRVVQGGHFFSDVTTSFFIVFFTARLLWEMMGEERNT